MRYFVNLGEYSVGRVVGIIILLSLLSCKDIGTNPGIGTWQSLGFEDKSALRLVLAEPYLYVCAGSDGLWRRDIRQMTAWEHLVNDRVVDVDVKGNDILIAGGGPVEHWASPGIWRSTDSGKSWVPSDKGIPDSSWPYSVYHNVQRSPHNPDIAITSFGGAVFRSTDGGTSWMLISGRRGGMANFDRVKWQPNREGVVWYFGETSIFAPYLGRAKDYGLSPVGCPIDFYKIGVPHDNAVYDIGFDAIDPYTVYVGMQGAVIKSTDDGCTWIVPLFTNPQGGFFRAIEGHPHIHNMVYFAGGKTLYYSRDGGQDLQIVDSPNDTQILSMVYDDRTESLFIGTETGIFRYATQR
jgi:hypothetical protein